MLKRLNSDIKQAMIARNKERLAVLRYLKSAFQNKAIELKKDSLTDEEMIVIMHQQVKSRMQAAELYVQGERPELAEKENSEIIIIKEYLPEQLSAQEIETEVDAALTELGVDSMKGMGLLMKHLKEKLGTRADGKILSGIVRKKLS